MFETRTASPMNFDTDVAIVGGGLAGLVAANRLVASGHHVQLLEARARLGGRILTTSAPPLAENPWLDLGPAWFWPHQQYIRALVAQLQLPVFEQYRNGLAMYEAGDGRAPETFDTSAQSDRSFRLVGGMSALTRALLASSQAASIPVSVLYDAAVHRVSVQHNGVLIAGNGFTGIARRVVMAAPPRVVARDIVFTPPLTDSLRSILTDTVTWMGHAMKCVATYAEPFWRDLGRSGYAVSWGGPLQEIHDACMPAHDGMPAASALMGFVAPSNNASARAFREASLEARRSAVLSQLTRLFGDQARHAIGYAEHDWGREPLSCGLHDETSPGAHPDYGHAAFHANRVDDAWNGRLIWAGTETSAIGGGYLEGAVASGWRAADTIISSGKAS